MAEHKGAPQPAAHRLIELGPAAADRASLEPRPGASTVEFYLLTAAAQRSLEAISATLTADKGAVFWIGGQPGAGKTHFLNYVLALEERAGATPGRRAIARLELDAPVRAANLERRVFETLAHAIGAEGRDAALWRQMRGAEALGVALDQARRVGIRAASVAIDFGAADTAALSEYFGELARTAAASRHVSFNVYVAARAPAPAGALALEVAPADAGERMLAAIARARRVLDEAAVAALYSGLDTGGLEPRVIFPFHALTLKTLGALAGASATVAALARLAGEVLATHRANAADAYARPVLPGELMGAAAVAKHVSERLGEAGRAARRIAYAAADAMEERERARAIVDALMLERLAGRASALSERELRARLPELRHERDGGADGVAATAALVAALAERSGGVIACDARGAGFNPRAAGAPEVAAFNAAMPLIRLFDSTLGAATELPELRARLGRLGDALADALEGAHRVAAVLEAAERETRGALAAEHRRTLDDFIALAEAGAAALVETGADAARREQAARLVAAYEALATAAAAVPRMRAMREYLRAAGLAPDLGAAEPAADKAIVALEIECQLLLGALNLGVLPAAARNFEALETRFQKFKWTYIEAYRAAHERRRQQSERLATVLDDARMHLGALGRLNSIAALGAPVGGELGAQIEALGSGIVRCEVDAAMALEAVPRCPRCGFALGAPPPAPELGEALDRVRRALMGKLAALSHSAIARLIREHDHGHRLDGFLKITQAAHTGALVRVLDDNLAGYLARLLDEAPGVVEQFTRPRRVKLR